MDTGRGEERVRCVARVTWQLTFVCKIDSHLEFAVWLRKLKQGLCINLEWWNGREMGGRYKWEGMYVYLWLINVEV